MSRASAAVRFPDGTIRYTIYNGTVDYLCQQLFDTIDEAWDAWNSGSALAPEAPVSGQQEPVEIYSDYGGGWWWPGTATTQWVIGPTDIGADEYYEQVTVRGLSQDGQPDWLRWN